MKEIPGVRGLTQKGFNAISFVLCTVLLFSACSSPANNTETEGVPMDNSSNVSSSRMNSYSASEQVQSEASSTSFPYVETPSQLENLPSVEYEFIGETEYDSTFLLDRLGLSAEQPYTFWIAVNSYKEIQNAIDNPSQQYYPSFTPPDSFDFDNYTLFVTFGRKLLELEYISVEPHSTDEPPPGTITIGDPDALLVSTLDAKYYGYIAFFYKIEKGRYEYAEVSSHCFLMVNGERIYMGENVDYFQYFDF